MKKIIVCILICIATLLIPTTIAQEEYMETDTHNIVISTGDNDLEVAETLTIHGNSNQNYSIIKFWVQSEAQKINVIVEENGVSYTSIGNNTYICNISSFNPPIKMVSQIQLDISYTLSKDIKNFKKKMIRNTTTLTVQFDKNNILEESDLKVDTYLNLQLYKPTETPISWYIIISISLLIILLVVSTAYLFRKQKLSKVKEIAGESEELLNTKKLLLMSILKDIEKQHRAKQISDDTYNKLKDIYKQQAVETMKKLEDMK
jgi:predicted small metal-binding protein